MIHLLPSSETGLSENTIFGKSVSDTLIQMIERRGHGCYVP